MSSSPSLSTATTTNNSSSSVTTSTTSTSSTTLNELSDNVKRLQEKLSQTQLSMLKIYEKANALKQLQTTATATTTTTTTTIQPPIITITEEEEDEKEEDDHRKEENINVEMNEKLKVIAAEKEATISMQQQRIALLEHHNQILRESVAKYEQAVHMIAQKSHEKWLQDTSLLQKHVDTLSQQLRDEQTEKQNLHYCNMRLKGVVQQLIHTMQEAATQRETELIESRSGAMEQEAENLRRMLRISEQYNSLDIFQDETFV